ncbi:MAG TPA: anti-sigma factor [Humisphaera sp.]|jgi:anti-sigma factor RsiW|nr:anti-sigma factor [Humisphaera sp.]
MDCAKVQELLHLHADGELDSLTTMELDRHFENCQRCAAARKGLASLRATMGLGGLYERAPQSFREQIEASLDRAAGRARPRMAIMPRWLAMAAVVGLVAGLGILLLVNRSRSTDMLASDVTASHIRSMMGDHLVDVHTSDKHVVKPWFQGKLDYSFDVTDLATSGFPLVGGRMDYVNGRSVAALVYSRGNHPINLFIWPASGQAASEPTYRDLQGYHLAAWTDHQMTYWAVSNVAEADLRQFVADVRHQ